MTLLRTLLITFFLAAVTAFLLTDEEKEILELDGTDLLQRRVMPLKKTSQPKRHAVIKFPNVVPLSKLGDFNVKKAAPKKPKQKKAVEPKKKMAKRAPPKPKPTPKPLPVVQRKPSVAPQPAVVSEKAKTKNTRPQFLVGYTNIGLELYLQVVENIGTLHLIIEDGESRRLGQRISFVKGKIEPIEPDPESLAVERPNLIDDNGLPYLMRRFPLPLNALTNSVVLYLNKPFDQRIWNVVTDELKSKNYKLSDIATVKGDYLKEDQNIFIFLNYATTKTGQKIPINQNLELPCSNCSFRLGNTARVHHYTNHFRSTT